MPTDQLTTEEQAHKDKIEAACRALSDAERTAIEKRNELAALLKEARDDKVLMRHLVDWVFIYDPKAEENRSVTRQSIDGMLAKFEGRPRAPRRRGGKNATEDGAGGRINESVFR